MPPPIRLTYIGHATVLIEMDGVRILTDPLLRNRVAHLRRRRPPVPEVLYRQIDAVLISHQHLDHLDFPSLRIIGRQTRLILPLGVQDLATRHGFFNVEELDVGDWTSVGSLAIQATYALHDGRRPPRGARAPALGFLLDGPRRIYFPGDTDVFPEMEDLAPSLDLALLPVWGWGPTLGDGHMDPHQAAKALALLGPRRAIPIHWGTFYPIGLSWFRPFLLHNPPISFFKHARQLAPQVDVRILDPGVGMNLA